MKFECPIVIVRAVRPVPNSDALEMTEVFETPVIFRKGQLKPGATAVYIPIEAMVPMTKPQFQGLGIKTDKELYRVKAVRLRGTYSEGLLVPASGDLGVDMAPAWGIVKYEEPEPTKGSMGHSQQDRDLPWVPKYNVENLLKNRSELPEGTPVQVTEKLHGCNGRYVYGKDANGEMRLNVGSHNVWKRPVNVKWYRLKKFINRFFKGAFDLTPLNTDVWWQVAKALRLEEKLKGQWANLVFYGEVYGKVQDLKYGLPDGVDFRLFDVYDTVSKTWLSPEQVQRMALVTGLKHVPVLYTGPYNKDVDAMRSGKSVLDSNTIREGIIIKKLVNEGRNTALKYVSEEYKLRKSGTEYK